MDDHVWKLDTGAKAIRKDLQSRWWKATVQQGDITKESEEIQIEALKEEIRELKEMYGEGISLAVIHVDGTATPDVILCR